MSGLVRKLSQMQKGRFECFCQRRRNSVDTWRSVECSMVANGSERSAVTAAITGTRAAEACPCLEASSAQPELPQLSRALEGRAGGPGLAS